MSRYKCIFFDLDHTLWDFETNSGEALRELYDVYELSNHTSVGQDEFCKVFSRINTGLWDKYDRGEIPRDVLRTERFHTVFKEIGIDDHAKSLLFCADYLSRSPRKKNLIPGALEILAYLHARYPLYIITNGFDEVQYIKMSSSGIDGFFTKVFTSEKIGHKKPAREIFDIALATFSHKASEAIMIGDNLQTDIQGARNAGVDQVFFNPHGIKHHESVTYEITDLLTLKSIL